MTASPPPYRLVIFDFDGTLADSFPWFIGILNEVAETFRFRPVQEDELEELRGLDARTILQRLGVPLWKLPMIASHMRQAQRRDIGQIRPFGGVPAMLRRLDKAGLTLAAVTSNSEENMRRVLGDAAGRFACTDCGASLFGKAARLRAVLRRTGTPAAAALFIGDEIRDADAARETGVAFGGVSWGYTRADALAAARPVHLFTSVEAVAETLAPPAS